MKIEYILVLKEKNDPNAVKIVPNIKDIIKSCFGNAEKNSFQIKYKRTNYKINYSCSTHKADNDNRNNAIYYLILSYGTSKDEITASILDFVHTYFVSRINSGKSKFHVTISYDERSLYFCSRIYPYFSEFESKLRCLILKLLTQTFGILWAEKTLTEEQINNIKAKMRGASIEKIASEALYEMDFFTLESYLFGKTRDISPEEMVDYYLSGDSLKELDLEGVTRLLESSRPKSNWERYFADKIEVGQLEEKLSVIREERNKVAHVKYYSKKDFDEDKQILLSFNTKLDEAIYSIEINNITTKDSLDIIVRFGLVLAGLSLINESIKRAFDTSKTLVDSFSSSINMPQVNTIKIDLPEINVTRLNIPNFDSSTINKINFSNQLADIKSKIDSDEIQRLRTSLLKIKMKQID